MFRENLLLSLNKRGGDTRLSPLVLRVESPAIDLPASDKQSRAKSGAYEGAPVLQ